MSGSGQASTPPLLGQPAVSDEASGGASDEAADGAVATGRGMSADGGRPAGAGDGRGAVPRGDQDARYRPAGVRDWPALPRRRPIRASRLPGLGEEVPPRVRWLLRLVSIAAPLVVWFVLSASNAVDDTFLPSPGAVWSAGVDMARSGDLAADTWASVRRVGLGFGIAVAISIPLGFAMGAHGWAQALLEPAVGLLRYMPASAFIPLLIIWMGLGEPSKVAILVIGVVFFNTLMTADVVRRVPRDLLDVSATLGARQYEVAWKVILPHALPGMIDAMRVNAAAAWNFVVVAELIAATSGLGYRIARSQRFLQTDKIFAVLVVIGLIGLTIDVLLRLVRERVGRWSA